MRGFFFFRPLGSSLGGHLAYSASVALTKASEATLMMISSPSRSCIIDGEAVACDENGVASFNRVRYRHHDESIFLYAFDLIERNDHDFRRSALSSRPTPRQWERPGCGPWPLGITRTARPRTAMQRPARTPWPHSPSASCFDPGAAEHTVAGMRAALAARRWPAALARCFKARTNG